MKTGPALVSLIYGTKAQFIKMMPVAWELDRRRLPYRMIDTGQHETITGDLRREYHARQPDHSLGPRYRNVDTIGRGVAWLASNLYQYGCRGTRARYRLFDDSCGIALVHGDTASTVLGTIIARRAQQKVMHIEAGLRSWNHLNPFPEELVRVLVMRMSDYLVAPSEQAYENLSAMSLKGRSWRVSGNTLIDVVGADLEKGRGKAAEAPDRYCVVTIHRMETLYNRKRLETVLETILLAQENVPVMFVQHAPTARKLSQHGMLTKLERAGVRMLDLMDHTAFVHLLDNAQFVITDGGSIQEESSYLGVPCLLMRMATERPDGLDGNIVLSEMDAARINKFIEHHREYRRPRVDFRKTRPSAEIVDILKELLDQPTLNRQ